MITLPFTPGFRVACVDESRIDDEVRRFRLYVIRISRGRLVRLERNRRILATARTKDIS